MDLLEQALRRSGQEALFTDSLVVLPEAFNIVGDYYYEIEPDIEVEKKLRILSSMLSVCFVVGLIRDDDTRHSEAVLIDGPVREVLSRKTLPDGSPCYTAVESAQDDIILYRGLRISSLICMDATEGDSQVRDAQRARHAKLVAAFKEYSEAALLCVPARFGASSPIEVAKDWNRKKLSIVIANCGAFTYRAFSILRTAKLAPLRPTVSAMFTLDHFPHRSLYPTKHDTCPFCTATLKRRAGSFPLPSSRSLSPTPWRREVRRDFLR